VNWSYASARRGKAGGGSFGDDATLIRYSSTSRSLVVAVADGAGSARFGGVGAEVACGAFAEVAEAQWSRQQLAVAVAGTSLADSLPTESSAVGRSILGNLREAVEAEAKRRGVSPMELATTLVGAVVRRDEAFFFQIGDGAAVFRQGDTFETAIIPIETEFVNATYFVTSPDAAEHILTRTVEGSIEEIALFSDGLQPLVLTPSDHSPHATFFQTVFRTLRTPGADGASAVWLMNMLGSDHVTARTDDDTSIALARRFA
jgi:hypothetical protein